MKNLIFPLLILFLFASCKVNNAPIVEAKPMQLSGPQKVRVLQDNDFAFELMKQTLAKTDETNVFISPMSVSLALGMVLNGAEGETRTEMENTLKMSGLSKEEINHYYRIMQTTLPGLDPKTKLSIANSIWYRNTFKAKQEFLKTNIDYFNSEVAPLNFNDPKSVEIINQWCSEKTNGLITQVLEDIDPLDMMFLINAVYFKGIWVREFDKKETREGIFNNEMNQQVKVNYMHQTNTFAYGEDEFAKYLDMPYGNGAFSMTLILPKSTNTAKQIFDMTLPQFSSVVKNLKKQEVEVTIPRFKVKNRFDLVPMLQAMGMNKAFTQSAEFEGIADMKPLLISMVQHDTYVEVTEEGTEAAAVTTVGVRTTSFNPQPTFIADKPFGFVIREKSSGVILFMGKMGDVEFH